MNLAQLSNGALTNSPFFRDRNFGDLGLPNASGLTRDGAEGRQGMDALQGALLKKLQRVPANEPVNFQNDYTPEKVADRLTNHIRGYMEREKAAGASDERLQELYDIGVNAVAEGFAEAREILDQMGVLGGQIAADIDQTFDLFSQQAAAMRDELIPPPGSPDTSTPEISTQAYQSYFAAEAIKVERSFDFELVTAEGDRVTISASGGAGYAQGSYLGSETDEEGSRSVVASSSASYQRGSFAFEVQGDLNEEELEAIDALLSQVNDLSDSFFSGNLDEAFNKALSLGFDSSQITRFELDLSQTRTYTAIEQYQSFQGEPAEPAAGIRELAEYARGLQEALEEASRFEQPKELLNKLLEFEDSLRAEPQELQGLLDNHRALNEWLLESL
ncbi:DUF5610 domain-containing protein [Aestuariirhabdus sp. Z084]|uniref:DUF5610 domain-containing protein n=1 Tax=Aestuariirhabdus haliotis TaxID=2918751 RepID=UPI00201B3749|nr:DUF5610 domain-containing protein [Aestuariirhabdus haliotis]MCL6414728.1 DUF5610 domain-containing protein [Aestuariirhabdus haliotis]MCL6418660.1 DUF5610 domain-containing protein [Aestuariirhabdus haliotis]